MGLSLVREDRDGRTSSVPVIAPAVAPGSYVRKGETLRARVTRSNYRLQDIQMSVAACSL